MLRPSRDATRGVDFNAFLAQGPDELGGTWSCQPIVALMDARSEGSIRLSSLDAEAEPLIRHEHLSDPADLDAMCDGIELVARLLATPPLAGILQPVPGTLRPWRDRAELKAWLLANVGTMFHPCGTCRMGPASDPLSVVDDAGRVHGIRGLRITDASVFPSAPRAAIHPTVVAAAEALAHALSR
jgi:choline dehydrogenase-like flavoprotein